MSVGWAIVEVPTFILLVSDGCSFHGKSRSESFLRDVDSSLVDRTEQNKDIARASYAE